MLKTLLLAAFAASTVALTLILPHGLESRRRARLYRAQEKWSEDQDRRHGVGAEGAEHRHVA